MYEVIGQSILLDKLLNKPLPNFIILWGEKGSGKKTIAHYLAQEKQMDYYYYDGNVDSVRLLIENTIAVTKPSIYYLQGDNMTIQAQNALLKLAEEPPHNVHIIIGVVSITNLLGTIRSRATTYMMDNYSQEELHELYNKLDIQQSSKELICKVATTPGKMLSYEVNDFHKMYDYCIKVYRNILKVSTGNAFKICNEIAFKDEQGYPVQLFLELFIHVVHDLLEFDRYVTSKMIEYTNLALTDMSIRAANKPLIFDIWVLNIRRLR